MYSVTGANTKRDLFGLKQSAAGYGDDSFSQIYGSSLKGPLNDRGGIQDMLSRLSERFPNLSVKEGQVGAGIEGADQYYGREKGNQVAVESAALSAMSGSADLAKKIEEAIASFMKGAGSVPAQMEGSYVQRTVTVTITTIRFGTFQRDAESGDMLAGGELNASLQARLQELIDRFFGKGDVGSDADKGGETQGAKQTDAQSDSGYSFSGMMWSMELFYSSSYVDAMGGNGTGAFSAEAFGFSASYSGFSGDFSQLTSGFLPQALFQGLSSFGQNGPFTSLLSGMGVSLDGLSQSQDGYLMKLRESRNLIAQLMELYGSRKRPEEVEESTETEEIPEESVVE